MKRFIAGILAVLFTFGLIGMPLALAQAQSAPRPGLSGPVHLPSCVILRGVAESQSGQLTFHLVIHPSEEF
jgi:hypothetical protein